MTIQDQIRALMQRWPAPTNAQALAALDSYGALPLDAGDLDDDPAGLTERLRWLAIGYARQGDKFAIATNTRHYAATFPRADLLYQYLDDAAARSDRWLATIGEQAPIIVIDDGLAEGEQGAIAQEVTAAWGKLLTARRMGLEGGKPAANMRRDQYEAIKEALRKAKERAKEKAPDLIDKMPKPPSLRSIGIVALILIAAVVAAGNVASNRR